MNVFDVVLYVEKVMNIICTSAFIIASAHSKPNKICSGSRHLTTTRLKPSWSVYVILNSVNIEPSHIQQLI